MRCDRTHWKYTDFTTVICIIFGHSIIERCYCVKTPSIVPSCIKYLLFCSRYPSKHADCSEQSFSKPDHAAGDQHPSRQEPEPESEHDQVPLNFRLFLKLIICIQRWYQPSLYVRCCILWITNQDGLWLLWLSKHRTGTEQSRYRRINITSLSCWLTLN